MAAGVWDRLATQAGIVGAGLAGQSPDNPFRPIPAPVLSDAEQAARKAVFWSAVDSRR